MKLLINLHFESVKLEPNGLYLHTVFGKKLLQILDAELDRVVANVDFMFGSKKETIQIDWGKRKKRQNYF